MSCVTSHWHITLRFEIRRNATEEFWDLIWMKNCLDDLIPGNAALFEFSFGDRNEFDFHRASLPNQIGCGNGWFFSANPKGRLRSFQWHDLSEWTGETSGKGEITSANEEGMQEWKRNAIKSRQLNVFFTCQIPRGLAKACVKTPLWLMPPLQIEVPRQQKRAQP